MICITCEKEIETEESYQDVNENWSPPFIDGEYNEKKGGMECMRCIEEREDNKSQCMLIYFTPNFRKIRVCV
ncbi:MAG: hypothetical protein ACFFG0_03755 [Candidatus Thorarchaeota archaeon]